MTHGNGLTKVRLKTPKSEIAKDGGSYEVVLPDPISEKVAWVNVFCAFPPPASPAQVEIKHRRWRAAVTAKAIAVLQGVGALSILLMFTYMTAYAGRVSVGWSPSPSTNVTYRIYAATNETSMLETNLSSSSVIMDVGTNMIASILFDRPETWYICATARRDGIESEPSNVLTVVVPVAPGGLAAMAVETTIDLSNTNGWAQVGFFRIRFENPP